MISHGKIDEPRRDSAKRAFVLADKLKNGPFDSIEHFLAVVESSEREVNSWSAGKLDSIIGSDPRRLLDYTRAEWRLDRLDLGRCIVWPKMGGRTWVEGYVPAVAEKFKEQEPKASRIWEMMKFGAVFASKLPIIVLSRGAEWSIDDGSHRAVAMSLAGVKSPLAWIGKLP
jgi:hypothetical protein